MKLLYCPKCKSRIDRGDSYCKKCIKITGHIAVGSVFMLFLIYFLHNFLTGGGDVGLFIFLASLFSLPIMISLVSAIIYLERRKKLTGVDYISGYITHTEGLPMPKGVPITFIMSTSQIKFKKDNQDVSLDFNKIISADITSGSDAKNNAMMGAIAGNLIVGGLGGAVLGSILAKSTYLIITYKSDEEIKHILLDTSGSDLPIQQVMWDIKDACGVNDVKIEL